MQNVAIWYEAPVARLTPDDEPGGLGGEGVLGGEGGAGHLALPLAVVEGDVGLAHLQAAVAQARLPRPLVLPRVDPDRLQGKKISQLTRIVSSLCAIKKRYIAPFRQTVTEDQFLKAD